MGSKAAHVHAAPARGKQVTKRKADAAVDGSERIDKWLWIARFYKTRSLAADALDRGKVDVNGVRAKRSRSIAPGNSVTVRKGMYATTVVVLSLEPRRGPASQAALMYEETAESKTARETIRVQLASLPVRPAGEGRPTKKERRQIRRLRDNPE
jgi:ribosome-associated heat shock protein Hsp15